VVKHAVISEEYYNSKYKNPPPVYTEGESVRVKKPQTPVGLKEKLRSDRWSEKMKINKVISEQNIEVVLPNQKTKILNVNNVKHAELDRDAVLERIRTSVTTTRSGRKSQPRFVQH
jgi:3-dehydroquinate synthetase